MFKTRELSFQNEFIGLHSTDLYTYFCCEIHKKRTFRNEFIPVFNPITILILVRHFILVFCKLALREVTKRKRFLFIFRQSTLLDFVLYHKLALFTVIILLFLANMFLLRPIYTERLLSHATNLQKAYDCPVRQGKCRSILKHVLKRCDNRKSCRRPVVSLSHASKLHCVNRPLEGSHNRCVRLNVFRNRNTWNRS